MSNSVQVPDGWKVDLLGNVASIIMGQSPPSSTYNDKRKGLPFFQGKTDFGAKYPKVRLWCTDPTKIASEGSILFSVRAPVGDVNIAQNQSCIGRGLSAITGKSVDQDFLYQYFLFAKPRFQLVSQGSTFEAVNGTEVKSFSIETPPLSEQKKIASILTSVDDVIEKTGLQISKLQDLKKGMMQELLTKGIGHIEFKDSPVGRIPKSWDVVKLETLCNKITDGEHQTPKRSDSGYYLLSARNIRNGFISLNNVDYIPESEFKRITKRLLPKENDILVSCSGSIGRVALVPKDFAFCMVRSVAILQLKNELVDPSFVFHQISAPLIQDQISKSLSQLAQANLFQAPIKALDIVFPPIEEQQEIGNIASSMDRTIFNKKMQLDKIKSLKKALMQDLLTGKVRVKAN